MNREAGDSEIGAILGLVVFIVVAIWAWNALLVPFWDNVIKNYDGTWWDGTAVQYVCDPDAIHCYELEVYANDDKPWTIYFPNGGYLTASSSACYKAAMTPNGADRFCEFYDTKGGAWDIMPIQ